MNSTSAKEIDSTFPVLSALEDWEKRTDGGAVVIIGKAATGKTYGASLFADLWSGEKNLISTTSKKLGISDRQSSRPGCAPGELVVIDEPQLSMPEDEMLAPLRFAMNMRVAATASGTGRVIITTQDRAIASAFPPDCILVTWREERSYRASWLPQLPETEPAMTALMRIRGAGAIASN